MFCSPESFFSSAFSQKSIAGSATIFSIPLAPLLYETCILILLQWSIAVFATITTRRNRMLQERTFIIEFYTGMAFLKMKQGRSASETTFSEVLKGLISHAALKRNAVSVIFNHAIFHSSGTLPQFFNEVNCFFAKFINSWSLAAGVGRVNIRNRLHQSCAENSAALFFGCFCFELSANHCLGEQPETADGFVPVCLALISSSAPDGSPVGFNYLPAASARLY